MAGGMGKLPLQQLMGEFILAKDSRRGVHRDKEVTVAIRPLEQKVERLHLRL